MRGFCFFLGAFLYFSSGLVNASTAGLLLDVDFDAGQGEVVRDKSGTNILTAETPIEWVNGRFGQAINFDGNQLLTLSTKINADYITVSAWVKPGADFVSDRYIVSNDRDCCDQVSQGGYGLKLSNHSLVAELWLENRASLIKVTSHGVLANDVWSHVAMTFDGHEVKLYINGELDRSQALSVDGKIRRGNKQGVIGGLAYNAPRYFKFLGFLDNVKVFDHALSDVEVVKLANTAVPDDRLSLYLDMDDSDDIVSSNGTLTGGQWVDGKYGRGLAMRFGDSLSFPALGNISKNKGGISFWVKPSWDGSADQTRYFFTLGTGSSRLKFLKSNGRLKNSLVLSYESKDCLKNCYRQVSTANFEPEVVMSWQPGEWHFVEFMWDVTADKSYMAVIIDGLVNDLSAQWDMTSFSPENFTIGSNSDGGGVMNSVIDDFRIYREPQYDLVDKVAGFTAMSRGDGVLNTHETVYNAPNDAKQPLADTVVADQSVVFYVKPGHGLAFEGEIVDEATIDNSLEKSVLPNQYETMYVATYWRNTPGLVKATMGVLSTQNNDVLAGEAAKVRVVNNWFQNGRTQNMSLLPIYTPELLLSDTRSNPEGGSWSYNVLPSIATHNHAFFEPRAKTSTQLAVIIEIPAGTAPGDYSGDLLLTSNGDEITTLPITLKVLAAELPIIDKDIIIYHRANLGDDRPDKEADLVSESRYISQLRDLKAHGVNSVTVYAETRRHLELIVQEGMAQRNTYVMGYEEYWKQWLQEFGLELWFSGVDEPTDNYKDGKPKMPDHIELSEKIDEKGGKVFTAITKTGAYELAKGDGQYYVGKHAGAFEPLDYANLSVLHQDSKIYMEHLRQGDEKNTDKLENYYWQSLQENPVVNRYYAGFHLWVTGLDGVFPYVYQHLTDSNPYDDFSPWSRTPGSKHRPHFTTYPSEQGPVTTVQWEAFREGVDDYRHLQLWKSLHEQLTGSADTQVAAAAEKSWGVVVGLLKKYRDSAKPWDLNIGKFVADREVLIDQVILLSELMPPACYVATNAEHVIEGRAENESFAAWYFSVRGDETTGFDFSRYLGEENDETTLQIAENGDWNKVESCP